MFYLGLIGPGAVFAAGFVTAWLVKDRVLDFWNKHFFGGAG